jgi:hypothetical protein
MKTEDSWNVPDEKKKDDRKTWKWCEVNFRRWRQLIRINGRDAGVWARLGEVSRLSYIMEDSYSFSQATPSSRQFHRWFIARQMPVTPTALLAEGQTWSYLSPSLSLLLGCLKVATGCNSRGENLQQGNDKLNNGHWNGIWRHPRVVLFQYDIALREHQTRTAGFNVLSINNVTEVSKARVLRADSPPTRSRRSIGSIGESSSMLTSVERNAVHCTAHFTVQGRMLLWLNLRRLLALKGSEWLITTPLNFQEWTRRTTAQLFLDCQL